ncbi:MAG: RNA methyltransferase [Muribaculaceae bacterium]|nr:RNA methyltransferase [Muribaculaceae bacterium]
MKKKSMLELHRLDVEEFKKVEKLPLVVVLDDVRSEMNVGSIFRTADAFLVEKIMLCGITSTPPQPEIHKTALGAEESVEWQYYKDVNDAIEQLKNEGYTICSLEQVHGSVSLEKFKVVENAKYAIILGNEVKGVQQSVIDASDCCIEIPQRGTKHSLNVANSAAITLWHFFQCLDKP